MLGPGHGQVKPAGLMSLYDATARQVHFAGHDFLVSAPYSLRKKSMRYLILGGAAV